jgi:hypothetical protein
MGAKAVQPALSQGSFSGRNLSGKPENSQAIVLKGPENLARRSLC